MRNAQTLTLSPAKRSGTLRKYAGQIVLHGILLFASLIALVPFVWMIFSSFKSFKELVSSTALLPKVWTVNNYGEIITRVNFLTALQNSVVVAVISTVAVVLTSSLCGYVFAKYRFPGKEILFTILLSTLMVPFAVVLIPLYIFIADIGLINKLGGIIVPGLWSTFGIFLMRQFMESIPMDLIDAARIDGASEWRIFAQIVLPLTTASMAALAILNFLGSWDNFLWPSLVLTDPSQQTLPILLNGLRSLYWTRYDMWLAGSMLTIIPVMTLYLIGSKQFIRGITMTGIKG